MSNLDPNRLLQCYGKQCKLEGKKHPAKELLELKPGKSPRYCKSCFDTVTKERADRKRLEETICRIFNIPSVAVKSMIPGQIKNLQNQGISLKNIRLSLEYFYDIRGNSTIHAKGIGIVPYIHDEMKEYHKARLNRQAVAEFNTKKVNVVKMEYPKKKYDHKQAKRIDLEALGNAISKQ